MYSLKKRITRNLTINLLAVMIGLLVVSYYFTQQLLHDYVLTHLQHDGESLASVISQDQAQRWQIDPNRMSTSYNRVRSGHYYYVVIGEQVIISRSTFDAEFPGVADSNKSAGDYFADGPGDERWMIWHQEVTKNGQLIKIWVAENIAPFQNQLFQYSASILGLIVIVVFLLFYLQQRTLHQSFRVFEWLRQNLATIRQKGTGDSGVSMPLEVVPLVMEIEKLVEHLSHRIVRTRNAMGNLAHELKRPLQLMSIQLENEQNPELQNALAEIKNVLERELRRARISGFSDTGGAFYISDELGYMTEVLKKIYPEIDIQVEAGNQIGAISLDRDDMLELIGNLFDNACKFARSRARLTVGSFEDRLSFTFEDDGEGLEPKQLLKVNRRGVRLDETVEGHGLGLGICRDILDYYHGDIRFSKSDLGGLRVYTEIPLR